MKKFFAVLVAVFIGLSSFSVAFAEGLFFEDVRPVHYGHLVAGSFSDGNGNYYIPSSKIIPSSFAALGYQNVIDMLSDFSNSSYTTLVSFGTVSTGGQYQVPNFYFHVFTNPPEIRFNSNNSSYYVYSSGGHYQLLMNLHPSYYRFQYGNKFLSSPSSFIGSSYPFVVCNNPYNIDFSSIDGLISDIASFRVGDSGIVSSRKFNLTVSYQYSNGTLAADSVTQSLAPGTEYSIPSPEVAGYSPDIPLVTGTMPEEDLTVTVTYAKAFYPLTVQYQYTDGSQAAESVSFQYPLGFVYDIPSPEIKGYQPDKPTIAGEMPGEALEEVVTYSAIPYTLTVQYLFTDGSQAAPDYQEQLTIGSSYSVPSPVIEGYHPNQTAVTGIMPASDVVSTVTYREDSGGSTGPGPSGPGGDGESGGEGSGGEGGGSGDDPFIPSLPPSSGYNPFVIPDLPEFSGYNPFIIPEQPEFSGYNPFIIPKLPKFSGYNPFIVPELPEFSGYDPFKMPEDGDS